MNLHSRISRRSGLGLAASAVAALAVGRVAAQDATPSASPVAGIPFPSGPLGEHAMWFVETLNAGPGKVTTAQINEHFSEVFFETTSMPTIFGDISDLQSSGVTWEVDPTSVISTMDMPSTVTSFVLIGSDGSETEVAMTLDRDSELIATLVWGPVGTLGGTPEASPVG
jgi:hypothetical protein